MNANRIINMVINRVLRIAVNKGVDAGIKGASSVAQKARRPKKGAGDEVYVDDFGNTVQKRDTPPRG